MEAGQLRLLIRFERFSIRVCGEFVVVQLVGKDGQFDMGIALQFPRNMKRVLVQLASARRKGCD
jgi:hypothetical protein